MGSWFVTAAADGTGDGTVGTPWNLSQAVTAISSTASVLNGDTVWIQADATYTTNNLTLTRAGNAQQKWVTIEGYSSVTGDMGIATWQLITGQTNHSVNMNSLVWVVIKNISIDGNGCGGGTGYTLYTNSQMTCYNVEVKNGNCSYCVRGGGHFINCYVHNNTDLSGIYQGDWYNSASVSNSGYGFQGTSNYNCVAASNKLGNYLFCTGLINCITDGGQGTGIYTRQNAILVNCIGVNTSKGSFALYDDYGQTMAFNCDFYNNTSGNYNTTANVINAYTLDPQFSATAGDYTRVGGNLSNLGLSRVGLLTSPNYNIDIGIGTFTSASVATGGGWYSGE